MKYSTRWLKTILFVITLATVVVLTTIAALAKDDNKIELKPGTIIPVTLNSEISSRTANAGDTFTATVDTDRGAYGRILAGATVTGYVRSATPRNGDQPGMLDLAFTQLNLADGTSTTISGEPASLNSKYVKTDNNGLLVAKNTSGNRGLRFAGIGAGAGALVGVLATGGLSLWDTLAGAGVGYGASTVNPPPGKVRDIDLQAGTQMGVMLGNRVTYYHRNLPAMSSDFGPPVQIGIDQDKSAEGLPLPAYATPDSRAMDIFAACDRDIAINPGDQETITTGLRFSIPLGFEAQLRPDYMLAQNDGLAMQNGPMTIDGNNHGVVRVTLFNAGKNPAVIHRGDVIAHLVVARLVRAELNQSTF